MAVTDKLQDALQRTVGPVAHKLSENLVIQGLSQGFMASMPMTLGIVVVAVIANLPIEGFQAFLASCGLAPILSRALAVTMNMQALYLGATIAFCHAEVRGVKGLTAAVLSLASMMIMCPLNSQEVAPGYSLNFISTGYLGSNGIFVAIILGIVIPPVLGFLLKHVSIKMPESVPPFVSNSISPTFAAIIILTSAVLIGWGMSLTPFGNIYDFISQMVAAPIMNVGGSPLAYFVVVSFAQFVWFFGVHPSSIMAAYTPILTATLMTNIDAFASGNPLPALMLATMAALQNSDSLALGICTLFTKSERYKALGRIAIVPSIFNITEPLMFGMPIVLNPMFFIPFVLAKPIICGIGALGCMVGLSSGLNPMVSAPFALPQFVSTFLQGGFGLLAINLIAIAVMVLLFLPFFRMADNQALAEERAEASEN